MKIEEQYKALIELKAEINERLKDVSFQGIKELMLWLAQSKSYQKLKGKENQLYRLDVFCNIWIEEKKVLSEIGIEDDIFWGVASLEDIEKKYLMIKLGEMRLETDMPEEYHEQIVDAIINYRISGIALAKIIYCEILKKEECILKLVSLLRKYNELTTAMILLNKAREYYPQNPEFLRELADIWLLGQQWERALECLQKIENPDMDTQKLVNELEKKVSHENV